MQSSIRFRLTAWYVGALALTFALLGAGVLLLTGANLYHWADETLEDRVQDALQEVRAAKGQLQLEARSEGEAEYRGSDDGLLLLDGSGQILAVRGVSPALARRMAAAVASGSTPRTVEGTPEHRWRVVSRPVHAGALAGTLAAAHDLHEFDEVMARLLWIILGLLPVALLVAAGGGYALAGRALAPVDRITRSAAEISEHDLSRRLPIEAKDELGRLATTFNALIERLQRAFERQRRFTADASHELRTPLSVVQAVASQKLMPRPDGHLRSTEEYEWALRQIRDAADYMTRLVNQLLTLARADSGEAHLIREPIELAELLEHAAGQVAETSGRIIPVHAAGPVCIEGDPVRLTQLFLNLLENAVKYTPPEAGVEVRVEAAPEAVRIVVRDTGAGIPPEHLPHVFERFYRVDKARSRDEGGTGLGLSIAQWIAKIHGGSIHAESQPGQGTRMIVTLPLQAGGNQEDRGIP